MVYFRWPLTSYPPYNQRLFERLLVGGLSAYFDLVIVEQDCDYAAICDLHEPDVALFESGNNNYVGPYIRVRNTASRPHVPKLGFMRADPMSPSRTTFYAEMEQWGVDTFFTYVTNAGEYLPEIADQLFYWPFFVDTSIYRDYQQDKLLPILMLGNTDTPQYEWRKNIRAALTPRFQTVVVPHVGYDPKQNSQALHDERFSRLINSAYITPTCGAMVKVLVNKHLEIPASGSLLLTEDTPIVREFGFVHMENCVFASGEDVCDIVQHLFAHPDEMARITSNGHDLVHARHTIEQRPQIRQWYELQRVARSDQRIVQTGVCADLTLVDAHTPHVNNHVASDATDRKVLRHAWRHLRARAFEPAMEGFARVHGYTSYMAEPRYGLATCSLLGAQPSTALELLKYSINTILAHGGTEPDPMEWALWMIALLCDGRESDARAAAQAFPTMHRIELERARWAVFTVAGEAERAGACLLTEESGVTQRRSIHSGHTHSFESQMSEWVEMLRACVRHRQASALESAVRRHVRAAQRSAVRETSELVAQ